MARNCNNSSWKEGEFFFPVSFVISICVVFSFPQIAYNEWDSTMPFDPLVQKVLKIISVANSLNITHLAHVFLTRLTSFFMMIWVFGCTLWCRKYLPNHHNADYGILYQCFWYLHRKSGLKWVDLNKNVVANSPPSRERNSKLTKNYRKRTQMKMVLQAIKLP
jgi:hypothetical protein